MRVLPTALPEVLLLEPQVFADTRGFFFESYNARSFAAAVGVELAFVQDNHSRSRHHVLRGLHHQVERPQGKLVRVVAGEVFDVAVDVRRASRNFGKWAGFLLSGESMRMAWIPPGFAHGFLVISDYADFLYKTTDFYAPEHERTLLWSDPDIGIRWPLEGTSPILAEKDRRGARLRETERVRFALR
jgi:dTDP-4-dehydrorhamnose 3,5-epimerase